MSKTKETNRYPNQYLPKIQLYLDKMQASLQEHGKHLHQTNYDNIYWDEFLVHQKKLEYFINQQDRKRHIEQGYIV